MRWMMDIYRELSTCRNWGCFAATTFCGEIVQWM